MLAEFENNHYKNQNIAFKLFPLNTTDLFLEDIQDEADAHTAWDVINQLIIKLKDQHHTIHICISGGRRILGLMTMSVAMLHFGHQDSLWHMYTPEDWIAESKNGALMHIPAASGFTLIQVPMMPWGSYFPALRLLTKPVTQGADILAAPKKLLDYGEQERKTAVIRQLTPRQKEVLNAFGEGLLPQEVADKLFISIKTVNSHKTVILAECRNAWDLPDEKWLNYRFIADKFEDSGN